MDYNGLKFCDVVYGANTEVKEMINKLEDVIEDDVTHPENNVKQHTQIVVERLLQTNDPDLVMAGLFHDLGKGFLKMKHPVSGFLIFPGHEKVSAQIAEENSDFIEMHNANVDNVIGIIENHVRFKRFDEMRQENKEQLMAAPWFNKLETFNQANNMLENFGL